MNIYELRRIMIITTFYTHADGATICYRKDGTLNRINIDQDSLKKELVLIGSLDEDADAEEFSNYQISQWDALNISIRFEAAREQEKKLENSDIFNAIAKIIKHE